MRSTYPWDGRKLRLECRDLLAAFWADDARIVDHGATVLAKFCVFCGAPQDGQVMASFEIS